MIAHFQLLHSAQTYALRVSYKHMYSHSHPKNTVVTKYPVIKLPVLCWQCRLTDDIVNISLMCLLVNKKIWSNPGMDKKDLKYIFTKMLHIIEVSSSRATVA